MDKKYKEFWIMSTDEHDYIFRDPYHLVQCVDDWTMENTPHYHVVEHAALESAEAEIARLREALESIAATDVVPEQCHGYFEGYQHYELVDCLSNDTELARKVLKESKERYP